VTVLWRAALLAIVLVGAACGGDDHPEGTPTTPSASDAITTFSTARFEIPFTLELPENWTAVERDVDLVQIWMGPSEMASPLEISISFDVVGTPEEVMAAYSSIDGTSATEPQAVSYGGFDALQLDLEVQQDGPRIPGGYRMGVGGRARFAAIDTGARALVVAMDPFTDVQPDADYQALYAQMADVLSTLQLG
jgi:hypothetical protein